MSQRQVELPRETIPREPFDLDDLAKHVPHYSGDIEPVECDHVPQSLHLGMAIAVTNVDQYHAFEAEKRDTLDALTQVWRALADGGTVEVEYSRSATSVTVDP